MIYIFICRHSKILGSPRNIAFCQKYRTLIVKVSKKKPCIYHAPVASSTSYVFRLFVLILHTSYPVYVTLVKSMEKGGYPGAGKATNNYCPETFSIMHCFKVLRRKTDFEAGLTLPKFSVQWHLSTPTIVVHLCSSEAIRENQTHPAQINSPDRLSLPFSITTTTTTTNHYRTRRPWFGIPSRPTI
jgi:hypothetical protein